MTNLEFENYEQAIDSLRRGMRLSDSENWAYAKVKEKGGGFARAHHMLKDVMSWIWLASHGTTSRNTIVESVDAVVTRAIKHMRSSDSPYFRESHDNILLQAVLIAGSSDRLKTLLPIVVDKAEHKAGSHYQASTTGLLKAALLGDQELIAHHLEQLKQNKVSKVFSYGSKSLFEAFVNRDRKRFIAEVKRKLKRFWDAEEKLGAMKKVKNGYLIIPQKKLTDHYWPWVEYSCLTILRSQGESIEIGDPAFPVLKGV